MGGIGHAISNAFGSNNEADVKAPAQMYQVKDNSFEYGGAPGQARVAAAEAGNTADEQRRMAAESTGQKNELYGYGQGALNEAQGARAEQVNALNMAKSRAQGQDLISQRIAQQQQQQLQQQQAGAAASARGPASLALAQQGAAANTALGQSTIANQAAISGAQEQLANQQAYANQAQGLRGTDLGAANTALGAGVAYGGLGVQQGQLGLGYNQLQNNINQSQLQAQMQKEALQSGNQNAAQALNAQVAGQNAAMAQKNAEGLIGLGGSIASAASTSDERAKRGIAHITGYRANGGPVEPGRAYVVGERGPEVIVPNQRSVVVPSTWGTGGVPLTGAMQQDQAATQHDVARNAEYNRIANMSAPGDPVERQTLAGMPATVGFEIANTNLNGNPLGAGTDAETQKNIVRGMQAAGIRPKAAEKTAEKASQTEAAQAAAKKGLGERIGGALGEYGKNNGYGSSPIDVSFHSDENAKLGIMPVGDLGLTSGMDTGPANFGKLSLGSNGPGSKGGGPASFDVLTPGGGMDVKGSFAAHNAADTQYQKHAGSSPTSYSDMTTKTPMMMSDDRAKLAAVYTQGKLDGANQAFSGNEAKTPAYAMGPREASNRTVTPTKGETTVPVGKSLVTTSATSKAGGESPAPQLVALAPAPQPQQPGGIRRVLGDMYDSLGYGVDAMHSGTADAIGGLYPAPSGPPPQQVYEPEGNSVNREPPRALMIDHAASTKKKFQPSDERTKEVFKKEAPMAQANRSQEGFSYAYKPQFTPPEQSPGEKNVGPMAQNMAANPIARTAVKKNPEDGMLMLDNNKLAKLHSASIASLQDQIDALHAGMFRVLGRGR